MVIRPLFRSIDKQRDVTSSARSTARDLTGIKSLSVQSVITITGSTSAGGNIVYQRSNDNINWETIGSATTFDDDGIAWHADVDPEHQFLSMLVTVTSGGANVDHHVFAQG